MKTKILNFCSIGFFGLLFSLAMFPSCTMDRLPDGKSCTLSVGTELFVVEKGDRYSITVNSDRPWSMFEITAPAPTWCTFSQTNGPAGSTTIYVTVETNPDDADARLADFQFHAGADGTVLTLIQKGLPKIATSAMNMDNVDEDLGLLEGALDYSNPREVEFLGFHYRKAGATAWSSIASDGGIASGRYSSALRGLTPSAEYEYRAYMKTGAGKEYLGDIETFTTYGTAVLTTVDAIRAMSGSVSGGYKIEAVVVSDTLHGNWPGWNADGARVYQIVDKNRPADPNMGIGMYVRNSTVAYNKGDVLEVKVTAAELGVLNLDGFASPAVFVQPVKISKTGTQNVDPIVITRDRMADHISQIVTIQNTQLVDEFINEANYPALAGSKDIEVQGHEYVVSLVVEENADFAGGIPPKGSGQVTGIVGRVRDNPLIQTIKPREAGDIALSASVGDRFNSTLALTAYSVNAPGMIVGTTYASDYKVTVNYMNGTAGEVIPGPVSVNIEGEGGLDVSGLTATAVPNYTVAEYGEGTIDVIVNGTMAAAGYVTFTVTGLESYGLTGNAAKVTVRVAAPPTDENFSVVWNLPTSSNSSGSNSSAYADPNPSVELGVNTSGSTPNGVAASAIAATGFYNGGNWGTSVGGSILERSSAADPLTYVSTQIVTPAGRTSLYAFSVKMRTNAMTKDVYFQYSVNSESYRSAKWVTISAQTSTYYTCNLFAIDELQDLPGGTVVNIRIALAANPPVVNCAWAIDGRTAAEPPRLTGKVE